METKTPGLTKLILIVESAFLVIAYAVLFILKNTQDMPNLSWLWGATMFFSAASFLFLFVLFIIALAKRSLRTTFFLPLLFIGFTVFLVITLIIYSGPSVMQPVVIDYSDQEMTSESTIEETEPLPEEDSVQHPQEAVEKSSEPAEMIIYNVGDLAEAGGLAVRVNGLRTAEKEEWDEQTTEGYQYLLVDISLENTGSQEMYIDTYSNFRLVGKDGRNFKSVLPMLAEGKIEGLLGPGRKIAGEVAYAVPNDLKEFEMEIFEPSQGMMSNEMVIISIILE
jgi:hypothetical protein